MILQIKKHYPLFSDQFPGPFDGSVLMRGPALVDSRENAAALIETYGPRFVRGGANAMNHWHYSRRFFFVVIGRSFS